jgi:hypothetical protein
MQYDWPLLAKRILDFYTETLNRVNRQKSAAVEKSPPAYAVSGQH